VDCDDYDYYCSGPRHYLRAGMAAANSERSYLTGPEEAEPAGSPVEEVKKQALAPRSLTPVQKSDK
jgi:hypothetical protein